MIVRWVKMSFSMKFSSESSNDLNQIFYCCGYLILPVKFFSILNHVETLFVKPFHLIFYEFQFEYPIKIEEKNHFDGFICTQMQLFQNRKPYIWRCDAKNRRWTSLNQCIRLYKKAHIFFISYLNKNILMWHIDFCRESFHFLCYNCCSCW